MAKAKLTIEQELQAATKVKPKAKEDIQTYLTRLVEAVQDLKDPQWEALSDPAQQWVNDGANAIKKDRDIEPFPDDEQVEEEADEKPAKKRGAKAEEDDEPASKRRGRARDDDDDEPPKKRGRAADDDDDDDKPARRRSRDDDDDEKPVRKRARDDDDDDEKPTRSRRGRDDDDDDNQEDEDVAKKKTGKKGAAKPAAKKASSKPKKVGAQVLIKKAVIKDPNMTTEKIVAKLEAQGVDATQSAVSTIRSGTLQTMRLIKELGMPKGDF